MNYKKTVMTFRQYLAYQRALEREEGEKTKGLLTGLLKGAEITDPWRPLGNTR